MKRRKFIGLLAAGATAWPVFARAQHAEGVRRIGVLMASEPRDPQMQARVAALKAGMQKHGWKVGTDVQVEVSWYGGNLKRATDYANKFAHDRLDAIVVNGTTGMQAVRKASLSIPTVFAMVGNPLGSGFVGNLARPGGNVTGFSAFEPEIAGKWVQMLTEIAPAIRHVNVLFFPGYEFLWRGAEGAAHQLGLEVVRWSCRDVGEIEHSVAAAAAQINAAIVVLPVPFFAAHRDLIVRLTAERHLPAIYPFRYYVKAGGLFSYGIDAIDIYYRAAGYIDRILMGEKAGNLPVQAPTKFEFVINRKTARSLGLDISATLLAQVNEVID